MRRFRDDGAEYFGPYTSSASLREAVSDLRRIFPLRSCSEAVFKDYARRGRPCIELEMRRCLGPCCGLVQEGEYARAGRGDAALPARALGRAGASAPRRDGAGGAEERFEDAARLRDRIGAVERTVERQSMVAPRAVDRDVFGLARRGGEVDVQVLHVRDGRVVGATTHAFSDVRLDDGEVMGSFLGQYYGGEEDRAVPGEVWTSVPVDDDGALEAFLRERVARRVPVQRPARGLGRELVEAADANAEHALGRRLEARESIEAALEELRERLGLAGRAATHRVLRRANLQGALPVASRVVFEDGRPVKAGYRRYRIRDATGGDDTACLRETLRRRLARVDREPLPDLLLVDGGKGQLGVVLAALKDAGLAVPAAGIAKERDGESPSLRVRRSGGLKAERVFLPQRKDPLLLPPSSRGLLLLQRIRDDRIASRSSSSATCASAGHLGVWRRSPGSGRASGARSSGISDR